MAASSWNLGSGAEGDQTPGSKKLTALAAGGMSNFIKVKRQEDWQRESSRWRRKAGQIVSSPYVSNFMALVVIIDSYCTCADIDARAVLNGPGPPLWVTRLSEVCLLLYTVEVVLLLLLKGFSLLKKDTLMLVDVVIIVCGYTEWIMAILFNNQVEELGVLRTLRFLRIIRLLRLLRKIHGLRELQKLVIMMATCLKTLAWSFLFCFVIMTVWAMLIVEMVNPLIRDLGQRDDSPFQDCPDCMVATSSVMAANLLLFKTVIAGDSWGQIAVPVMREHPATGVIFVGSLLTIVFGVLNLIVAVVVDTFAEARERDVLNLAEEMERNHENDKKFLQKVFERIDEDGSGELTLEELVEGARKDPEFQSRLRVMDIDEVDLQQLFEMIDVDGSGSIEAAEFIAPLSRWVHDSKTAPRFIKYNMLRSMQQQEDIYRQSFNQFTALSTRMDELTESIQSLTIPSRPLVSAHDFLLPREEEAARRTSKQLSERTESLDEVAVAEDVAEEHLDGPEQPQASKPADWRGPRVPRSRLGSDDQGGAADAAALAAAFQSNSHMLKAAVESLEKSLVSATEHALKKSMAMLEYAIHEEISNVEGRAPASRRASDLARDVFRAAPSRPGSGRPEEAPVFITRRASGEGWSAPKETGTDSKTGTESKDTKDTPPQGMGKEDPGEHIKRRGRRIATTELAGAPSLHYSRKAARHSLANAQFQFSGRI